MQTESAQEIDNVGLDFLSAFKDVRLILQNSSDVRAPLYMLTLSGISFEAIVNDLEKKRLD